MFLVIGERINTSRPPVREAVADRDADYIRRDVKAQEEAGASYIDVNAGARIGHEVEDMEWLLEVIQDTVDLPLSLDSPDPSVLERAYGLVEKTPMINSVSLESERWEAMLPFLEGKDCSVIGLCMSDSGMPANAEDILRRAESLSAGLEDIGIERGRIYMDPVIQPISTDQTKGRMVLEAIEKIKERLPGIHFACGLSNISYGLPQRRVINRTFLALLMGAGLDGAIIDPLDDEMMATVFTTEMLLGNDEFCGDYLDAVRAGRISA